MGISLCCSVISEGFASTLLMMAFRCCSLNECYFANKGAAVVLGASERGCGEQRRSPVRAHPPSDIQHHLQSMFYLLRPEETLKMV